MNKSCWLKLVCNIINCKKRHSKRGYLPISLFLVAGRFSNQSIDNIMSYGDKFIKELNY
jgi:hypothetical protein